MPETFAGFRFLLAELHQFGLLLGRKDKALVLVLLLLLQFVDLALGLLLAFLQALDFALELLIGGGFHRLHFLERPVLRRATAHADQVAVPGQLLDSVLGEVQVAVERLGKIAEGRLNLAQREIVVDHIRVADQDHRVVVRGFLEPIRRLFFFLFLIRFFVRVLVLLLFFRRAVGESRLEFPGQPDRQRVSGAGGLELLHDVLP